MGLGVEHEGVDLVALGGHGHGSKVAALHALLDGRQALQEVAHKGVDEGRVHEDALSRDAVLAEVEEGAVEGAVSGRGEIDGGQDDVRVLAAQLEDHGLEVLRRRRHDALAGLGRADEEDLSDAGRSDERVARGAVAGHEGNEGGGMTALDEHATHQGFEGTARGTGPLRGLGGMRRGKREGERERGRKGTLTTQALPAKRAEMTGERKLWMG